MVARKAWSGIGTLTSAMPVQCFTSWASLPSELGPGLCVGRLWTIVSIRCLYKGILCIKILFIPDLPRPHLLLHGVIREMWLLCLANVHMCHPCGNLPHFSFIFALCQLLARTIPFSFPLLSDIFQSGFRRNSDDIKGHSVHSNHIQGYEHYVAFPASPFHDALHIINSHDVVYIA